MVNLDDLIYLFETLNYWMISDVPTSLMKYVIENGSPACAAICRNYDIQFHELRLLQSLQGAHARGGHLDCLRYAYEHGAPLTEVATSQAATNGHLPCLEYAIYMAARASPV